MTTAWVLKSAITPEDIDFKHSCGILSKIIEFGKRAREANDIARWWHVEQDPDVMITHTMRVFFYIADPRQHLLLQLRYGDRVMLANEHWTHNLPGINVDMYE